MEVLSAKRRQILEFIADSLRAQGYPPSVREIGEAVGLASSASVHSHLALLQREGYLLKDPTKPRAIQVRFDPVSEASMTPQPGRQLALIGDVAAGTGVLAEENVEELLTLPEQFTGSGEAFMLRVRGESMIEAGILDGDYVVVRRQDSADSGDIVVAGLPDGDATVKRIQIGTEAVTLIPANATMEPMVFAPEDVAIFGKVISVLRRL
ncbi:MAG: transcriptional repressor LexA [Actinomycetes bacterium]